MTSRGINNSGRFLLFIDRSKNLINIHTYKVGDAYWFIKLWSVVSTF